MSNKKVAVLGAGAGGTATAYDYASHGHEVRLFDFPQFSENIDVIQKTGIIHSEGELTGQAKIALATTDLDAAIDGADIIYIVGPAYSTEPFGAALAGKLKSDQIIVVSPGSCGGAFVFRNAAKIAPEDTSIRIAETSTLNYAVRLLEPGKVHIFLKLKAGNLLSVLPGHKTAEVYEELKDVYPALEPAKSVLQTTLQNANPIIHPAVSIANAARIDTKGENFLFYEDGVSDATGRLIEAMDLERIAIGKRLGLEILPDPVIGMRQGYMLSDNYGEAYRNAPGFEGITAQPQLDHRYINEDVGYGLVFMSALGQQIGVATPTIDSVIKVASVLMNRDYLSEAARTPETLGIGDLSVEQLMKV